MVFQLKQQPSDFIVEEELLIDWEGDYLVVYFQKENKNTMDVIHALKDKYWLARKQIWLSWLKDKKAITSQRFSFHKETVKDCWWKQALLAFLSTLWVVVKTSYHKTPITVGSHQANTFSIYLRARKKITPKYRQQIEHQAQIIQTQWFPNTFWKQRFWKGSRNYDRAIQILEDYNQTQTDSYQQTFALQAYPSYWFNKFCETHRETLFEKTPWALCIQWIPTWPLLWHSLSLPEAWTQAYHHEQALIEQANYHTYLPWLTNFWIRWRRRALYCIPTDFRYQRVWNDLQCNFALPVWSYATSLLSFMTKNQEA